MANFALDISKFIAKTKKNADSVMQKITIEAGSSLVMKTPFDTGMARFNWQPGKAIISGVIEGADKSGSTPIANIVDFSMTLKAGDIAYISNSLPYIQKLENGWSKQAISGMVKLTVVEFKNFVARAMQSL